MINWGRVPIGSVLPFIFGTYDGGTGASITMTGIAVGDIEVYKGTSMTQRASDAGYALLDTDGIDLDSTTGIQGFSIDTGDDTDSGFFAAGSFYTVVLASITVDGQTVNAVMGTFYLVPAEAVAGIPDVNVTHWNDTAVTTPPAVNMTQISGDSAAADNAEAFFDGTGYAGTGNTIPTVTDLTNKGDGSGFTAIPWNASWDAEVQSEVNDGLVAFFTSAAQLVSDIWGAATRVLTAATNITAGIADAVWDEAQADHTGAGSFGEIATELAAVLVDTSTTLDDLVDDLEDRLTAALATQLAAHSLAVLRGVVDASSTTTAVIFKTINGAAASATDDFYNGRHIVFTSGTLLGQACSISDYDGGTVTATVSALTGAPAEDVTFVIV